MMPRPEKKFELDFNPEHTKLNISTEVEHTPIYMGELQCLSTNMIKNLMVMK